MIVEILAPSNKVQVHRNSPIFFRKITLCFPYLIFKNVKNTILKFKFIYYAIIILIHSIHFRLNNFTIVNLTFIILYIVRTKKPMHVNNNIAFQIKYYWTLKAHCAHFVQSLKLLMNFDFFFFAWLCLSLVDKNRDAEKIGIVAKNILEDKFSTVVHTWFVCDWIYQIRHKTINELPVLLSNKLTI